MKRRLFAFSVPVALLSACGDDGYARNDRSNSTPFLYAQPGVFESTSQMMSDAKILRLRQAAGSKKATWQEVTDVVGNLLKTAVSQGQLQPPMKIDSNGFATHVDKRFILASIKPDILLLVPHAYQMDRRAEGPPYWHTGSISIQLSNILNDSEKKLGLVYERAGLQSAGLTNYAELSSTFPKIDGTKVLSDKWNGARTLEQMEQDTATPFKVIPAAGMPGYLRLVLKESGKTSP